MPAGQLMANAMLHRELSAAESQALAMVVKAEADANAIIASGADKARADVLAQQLDKLGNSNSDVLNALQKIVTDLASANAEATGSRKAVDAYKDSASYSAGIAQSAVRGQPDSKE